MLNYDLEDLSERLNENYQENSLNRLHSNDNKDIAAKPNLNKKNQENQTKKELKPLNEEQDGIKENSINTNSFNFIFDILKKINYQTERISKIKGDITQKDIKNITLFEVRNKNNKKKKNNRGGKTKKNVERNAEKNKIKFGIKKLDDMNTSKEIIKKIVQIVQIISSRK